LFLVKPSFSQNYIGLSPDFLWLQADQRFSFDPNKVNNIGQYSQDKSFNSLSINGNVRLGYQYTFNQVIAAVEVDDTFLPSRVSKNNNDFNAKLTQNNSVAVKLKFGREHDPRDTIYLIGGYAFTWVKYQVNFKPDGIYNAGSMLLNNISKSEIG